MGTWGFLTFRIRNDKMSKTNTSGVYSGNRYVYNGEGTSPVFERDVDKLFVQYENLRRNVFHTYRKNFENDYMTQQELKSYIDEQFIILVKEYNINSKVDFPGYIKTKLYARVSQSFVRGRHRDSGREVLERQDYQIQDMLDNYHFREEDYSMELLLEDIFKNHKPSELEEAILMSWVALDSDSAIRRDLSKLMGITQREVGEAMEELREHVKEHL